jgi:hypothetical protein
MLPSLEGKQGWVLPANHANHRECCGAFFTLPTSPFSLLLPSDEVIEDRSNEREDQDEQNPEDFLAGIHATLDAIENCDNVQHQDEQPEYWIHVSSCWFAVKLSLGSPQNKNLNQARRFDRNDYPFSF